MNRTQFMVLSGSIIIIAAICIFPPVKGQWTVFSDNNPEKTVIKGERTDYQRVVIYSAIVAIICSVLITVLKNNKHKYYWEYQKDSGRTRKAEYNSSYQKIFENGYEKRTAAKQKNEKESQYV